MNNMLGSQIGVVGHSFSITNDNGDKVQLSIKIDFSNSSDQDLKTWLVSNRIIAGQRPWRKLSKYELIKLNGTTFMAESIGQKVKSLKETTTALLNQFNGKSKQEIIESLMQSPNMTELKAELLADAMMAE